MNNGTTAPPGYVLPSRPRWQGGVERSGSVGRCRHLRHGSQRCKPMACSTAQ